MRIMENGIAFEGIEDTVGGFVISTSEFELSRVDVDIESPEGRFVRDFKAF